MTARLVCFLEMLGNNFRRFSRSRFPLAQLSELCQLSLTHSELPSDISLTPMHLNLLWRCSASLPKLRWPSYPKSPYIIFLITSIAHKRYRDVSRRYHLGIKWNLTADACVRVATTHAPTLDSTLLARQVTGLGHCTISFWPMSAVGRSHVIAPTYRRDDNRNTTRALCTMSRHDAWRGLGRT
ncbi:hypothetical protein BJV77DRAFT_999149, partial [Russula vinacea]